MDILMPQLGETVTEGKITKWFKAAGDAVKPGDNLFEIETDKTSMEVPATSAGVLSEIRAQEGETVPVGTVVAIVSGDGVTSSAPAPAKAAATAPAAKSAPVAQTRFHIRRIGPAAFAVASAARPVPCRAHRRRRISAAPACPAAP